jgi:hypothetical protein
MSARQSSPVSPLEGFEGGVLGRWAVFILVACHVWQPAHTLRGAVPEPDGRLRVRVYNYAEVPPTTLALTEQIAGEIFLRTGTELLWVDCPVSEQEIERMLGCRSVPASMALTPKIVPEWMAIGFHRPSAQCGLTIQGHGSYVFFHRVQAFTQSADVSLAVILGYVVAHELGHLVLGAGSHSATGIMSENFHPKQSKRGESTAPLSFSPEQSERIRTRPREQTLARK